MKLLFGYYNGCYWLCISNLDDLIYAMEHMKMTQTDADVYIEILLKKRTVFLNEAGGYHSGLLKEGEKTQFISQCGRESNRYPNMMDRVNVMEQEVIADIHSIQDRLGIPRTENLIFD